MYGLLVDLSCVQVAAGLLVDHGNACRCATHADCILVRNGDSQPWATLSAVFGDNAYGRDARRRLGTEDACRLTSIVMAAHSGYSSRHCPDCEKGSGIEGEKWTSSKTIS